MLPALKLGQIWQCRSQDRQIKIETIMPTLLGQSCVTTVLVRNIDEDWPAQHSYSNISWFPTPLSWAMYSARDPSPYDLVTLLYCPTWGTGC
jgi:hypothetical protein